VTSKGLPYVGQSIDISARLAQHVASGKVTQEAADQALRWAVPGGKTAREVAEQLRINELKGLPYLANLRNPIGAARAYLISQGDTLSSYLAKL
jgi:hypothetical protein